MTIIILLILAGVTLNMALSQNGLFSRAQNAANKYKKAQSDEEKLISEIGKEFNSDYVGAYVTGYEPSEESCTVEIETNGENFRSSYYMVKYDSNSAKEEDWINTKYYDLLFKKGDGTSMEDNYILSTRVVKLNEDYVGFGMCAVNAIKDGEGIYNHYNIYADENYKSNGETHTSGFHLRPIVSINLKQSGYKLERIQEDGKISFKLTGK